VHSNENFRRGNFTSADMRESNFSGSYFNGAYLEKAVAFRTNFRGKTFPQKCIPTNYLSHNNMLGLSLIGM
jgi:uncharacterized protein YjbI with pentapeptide repeats